MSTDLKSISLEQGGDIHLERDSLPEEDEGPTVEKAIDEKPNDREQNIDEEPSGDQKEHGPIHRCLTKSYMGCVARWMERWPRVSSFIIVRMNLIFGGYNCGENSTTCDLLLLSLCFVSIAGCFTSSVAVGSHILLFRYVVGSRGGSSGD